MVRRSPRDSGGGARPRSRRRTPGRSVHEGPVHGGPRVRLPVGGRAVDPDGLRRARPRGRGARVRRGHRRRCLRLRGRSLGELPRFLRARVVREMHALPRRDGEAPPDGPGSAGGRRRARLRRGRRPRGDDDRRVHLRPRDDGPRGLPSGPRTLPRGIRGPRPGSMSHGMVRAMSASVGDPEEVRVTIDGQAVSVPAASTVLEAASRLGISVPTLCYDPRLPIAGACRMCIVEEEGAKTLVPACARAVREGLRVSTTTPRVERARKVPLELLLADHPRPCEKARLDPDGCELERHARTYRVGSGRFPASDGGTRPDPSNPAILFDPIACIDCYRCVRACDEVQVNDVIGIAGRGSGARIIFDLDDPMGSSTCVSCGECVQSCPTGALMDKTRLRGPPEASLEIVRSVCPDCGVGCLVDYHVDREANRVAYATGAPDGPANLGRLCVKGRYGWDYAGHRQRLTVPLVRREGVPRGPLGGRPISDVFREATWEEALDLVAAGLRGIRGRHGPRALAGLSSAKCTNEENYLFQKILRAGLGTPNVDHCTRLCHSSSVYALQAAIGSGSMSNTVADFSEADVLFVIGSNTTENHPVIATFLKQAAN